MLIQGYEWVQLIHFGLTVSSSVYGGLFYTLIGFHGLHVFGALIWLLVVLRQARRGSSSQEQLRRLANLRACIGRLSSRFGRCSTAWCIFTDAC